MKFNTIDEALKDIRQGKLVIVMDSKDREYEGDFVGAGIHTTPETINFLTKIARGAFIAVFVPAGWSDRLDIPPMGASNTSFNQTKFRVAVDARSGSSGSSAHDRAKTVNLLASNTTKPSDFVKPGHVVPIEAVAEGVLKRQGHTEAGVELMRLAGIHPPVAVDLEILDDDGSMAHEKKLFALAKTFGLKLITVDEIVSYVKNRQKMAKRTLKPLGESRP